MTASVQPSPSASCSDGVNGLVTDAVIIRDRATGSGVVTDSPDTLGLQNVGSSSNSHVQRVISIGSDEQMVRTDTGWIIARVSDDKPFRDYSMMVLPHHLRGSVGPVHVSKVPVVMAVPGTSEFKALTVPGHLIHDSFIEGHALSVRSDRYINGKAGAGSASVRSTEFATTFSKYPVAKRGLTDSVRGNCHGHNVTRPQSVRPDSCQN